MSLDAPSADPKDFILVCGLGRLGRQCVLLLKEFGVNIVGIERVPPVSWAHPDLPGLLNSLIIGDCGQAEVLQRAGVAQCRAALLVTGDERTNIAAAFAVRSLNPDIRLIIRSAQENLNELLRQLMGNLVAFEPSQFSANVFALASLGATTQALLDAGQTKLRVVSFKVQTGDTWCEGRLVSDLNTSSRRILSYDAGDPSVPSVPFVWPPDQIVLPGNVLSFIESANRSESRGGGTFSPAFTQTEGWTALGGRLKSLFGRLNRIFTGGSRIGRLAIASLLIMAGLLLSNILFYRLENPEISWFDAMNASVVLAMGGFDNLFGSLHLPFPISTGLYFFSLAVTVTSTVFLGIIYALMTERILSARLQLARHRPQVPEAAHTIVIGIGVIGRKVANVLRELHQPMILLAEQPAEADMSQNLPLLVGPLSETLQSANVASAKSVIVLTDDDVVNLEICLRVRSFNPKCNLVFRTSDQEFAKNVMALVPSAIGIGEYAVAAEAIAGASFGENILSAFHLDGRSVLVTEYSVCLNDTLIDRLLAEIAYGYGVTPIIHQRGDEVSFFPSDDIRLEVNDRTVVLATIEGLKRIETGQRSSPNRFLKIEKAVSNEAAFLGANLIARISGCDLRIAREAMQHLPQRLDFPLYHQQGVRLVRDLRKVLVISSLEMA